MPGHQCVELVHPDRPALAPRLTLTRMSGAGVVLVNIPPVRCARPQRHAATTGGTHRQTCEQNGARYYPRRRYTWIAHFERRLHPVERLLLDDGGHIAVDDLAVGLTPAGAML